MADLPGDGNVNLVVHGGEGGGPGSGGASALAGRALPTGGVPAGVRDPQVEPLVILFLASPGSRILTYDDFLLGSVCTFRLSEWLFQGSGSGQRQVSQPLSQRTRQKRDAPQLPLDALDGVQQVYSKTGGAGQGGARPKTATDQTTRAAETASIAVVEGI